MLNNDGDLTAPSWLAWDAQGERLALGYDSFVAILGSNPVLALKTSVPMRGSTGGVWNGAELCVCGSDGISVLHLSQEGYDAILTHTHTHTQTQTHTHTHMHMRTHSLLDTSGHACSLSHMCKMYTWMWRVQVVSCTYACNYCRYSNIHSRRVHHTGVRCAASHWSHGGHRHTFQSAVARRRCTPFPFALSASDGSHSRRVNESPLTFHHFGGISI